MCAVELERGFKESLNAGRNLIPPDAFSGTFRDLKVSTFAHVLVYRKEEELSPQGVPENITRGKEFSGVKVCGESKHGLIG